MLEKLNQYNLKASEIETLNTFQSRDGFVLLDEEGFEEMMDYFSQFPVYKNLVPFITDENSNYWCVYINGPMKGMVCYLSHDEPDLAPKFQSVSNLLKVINENDDAYDFYDLTENNFDFPSKNISEFEHRKMIIEELKEAFGNEADEDIRRQLGFSIIALTVTSEVEKNIYLLLNDEDMYVQEQAIRSLGFHQYQPALEKLNELKTTALTNGRKAIETVLKKLNGV